MPNQFKEVTTTSYGNRVGKSVQGMFAGIVLFFSAFGVLYWNEGAFDFSLLAKKAVPASANDASLPQTLSHKIVAFTGLLTSDEQVGDNIDTNDIQVAIKANNYIALRRSVEMYGWVEEKKSTRKKNFGGSETTETNYEYKTKWITLKEAEKAKDFKYVEDHENPQPIIHDTIHKVISAQVGTYSINMNIVDLPEFNTINLSDDSVELGSKNEKRITFMGSDYIFIGLGTVESPRVGDLRLRYSAVPSNVNVTIFGKIEEGKITAFTDEKNNTLYRIFTGTKDEAIEKLHTEYTTNVWMWRLVGFMMMWTGLMLLLQPLSTMLDIMPVAGFLSKALLGVVSFAMALLLVSITILVSMVIHNLLILLIVLASISVAGLGVGLKFLKKKK